MEKFIVSLLRFVFRKSCASIEKSAHSVGYKKAMQEIADEKEHRNNILFQTNHAIGSFVIAVPNEHQNMIIGQIIGHDCIGKSNSPVALVRDYVRGEDVMLLQRAFPYSESFAEAVSDLNPFNRHVLFYGSEKRFAVVDENTIVGWSCMKEQLAQNGFFDALEESL